MKQSGPNVSSTNKILSINIKRNEKDRNQTAMILHMRNLYIENAQTITENIITENSAPYILLKTNLTEGPIKMLIDTGANISIISSKQITNKNIKIANIKYNLMGFNSSNEGITTMGLVTTIATMGQSNLDIPLHVVNESCMGKIDGLLGFDFLMKYGANLDINKSKIHVEIKKQENQNRFTDSLTLNKRKTEGNNENIWIYPIFYRIFEKFQLRN